MAAGEHGRFLILSYSRTSATSRLPGFRTNLLAVVGRQELRSTIDRAEESTYRKVCCEALGDLICAGNRQPGPKAVVNSDKFVERITS